jgi:hypothetical protein
LYIPLSPGNRLFGPRALWGEDRAQTLKVCIRRASWSDEGRPPSASKPNLGNPSVSVVHCRAACLRFALALSSLVLARLDVLSPIRTVSGPFCMNEESCIWGALLPSPVSSSSQASAQLEIGDDLPAGVIALHGMVDVRRRCLSLGALLADFGARCLFVFFLLFCQGRPFPLGNSRWEDPFPLRREGTRFDSCAKPEASNKQGHHSSS